MGLQVEFRKFRTSKVRRSGSRASPGDGVCHSATGRIISRDEFEKFRALKARLCKIKFAQKMARSPSASDGSEAPESRDEVDFVYKILDDGRVMIFGNITAEFQTKTSDWG